MTIGTRRAQFNHCDRCQQPTPVKIYLSAEYGLCQRCYAGGEGKVQSQFLRSVMVYGVLSIAFTIFAIIFTLIYTHD